MFGDAVRIPPSYRDFFWFFFATLKACFSTFIVFALTRACGLGGLTVPVFTDGAVIGVPTGGLGWDGRRTSFCSYRAARTPLPPRKGSAEGLAGLPLLTIPSFTVGVGEVRVRLRGATRLFLVGAKGILFFLLFVFAFGFFGVGYVLGVFVNGVRE